MLWPPMPLQLQTPFNTIWERGLAGAAQRRKNWLGTGSIQGPRRCRQSYLRLSHFTTVRADF